MWRLPFAFGYEMGQVYQVHKPWHWWVILYVFGLSVLSEGLAYLTFGLLARWGEIAPSWMPFIGGRRIPPLAAIVPGALGGLGLIALWDPLWLALFHIGGVPLVEYSNGWWKTLAMGATLPLTLWGPLLLAVTYAYYKRRREEPLASPNGLITGPAA